MSDETFCVYSSWWRRNGITRVFAPQATDVSACRFGSWIASTCTKTARVLRMVKISVTFIVEGIGYLHWIISWPWYSSKSGIDLINYDKFLTVGKLLLGRPTAYLWEGIVSLPLERFHATFLTLAWLVVGNTQGGNNFRYFCRDSFPLLHRVACTEVSRNYCLLFIH